MIRIHATKMSKTAKEEVDYILESDSIHDIFDEVRKLWSEGFYVVAAHINEEERLLFDICGKKIYGRLKGR